MIKMKNKLIILAVVFMFVIVIGLLPSVYAQVNPEKCHDVKVKIKIIDGEEVIEFKIHKNSCIIDSPFLNGGEE